MTDSLGLSSMTSLDASTPTLDSASSSYSDGSMSPTSSLARPCSRLRRPQCTMPLSLLTPSRAFAGRKDPQDAGTERLRGRPRTGIRRCSPAPEVLEEALRAMPGGNAELWQPSKQDLKTAAAGVVGQAFCKFAAQSGFTSLDHYETLKKRKYTINNLEA